MKRDVGTENGYKEEGLGWPRTCEKALRTMYTPGEAVRSNQIARPTAFGFVIRTLLQPLELGVEDLQSFVNVPSLETRDSEFFTLQTDQVHTRSQGQDKCQWTILDHHWAITSVQARRGISNQWPIRKRVETTPRG